MHLAKFSGRLVFISGKKNPETWWTSTQLGNKESLGDKISEYYRRGRISPFILNHINTLATMHAFCFFFEHGTDAFFSSLCVQPTSGSYCYQCVNIGMDAFNHLYFEWKSWEKSDCRLAFHLRIRRLSRSGTASQSSQKLYTCPLMSPKLQPRIKAISVTHINQGLWASLKAFFKFLHERC